MAKSSDISPFRIFVMFCCALIGGLVYLVARLVWGLILDVGLQTPDSLAASPIFAWKSVNQWILWTHIATALPPLVIGTFGFLRGVLRHKTLRPLHRWVGTAYVYTIFVSAITGFFLAVANKFGPMAKAGFATLAVVWFLTTYMALMKAKWKNFIQHREWMIRSYMVTLAVITVRLLPTPEGLTLAQWYPWVTWLCWVPNLIIAEIYIRLTTFKGELRKPGQKRRRGRDRRAADKLAAGEGSG